MIYNSVPTQTLYWLTVAWQPTPVFLFGESPRTEEPGGGQSMELQRVRHNRAQQHMNSLTETMGTFNAYFRVIILIL